MNATISILAALHARERSGVGQWIDLSMLDVQVSWLANQAQAYFATGIAPARTGDQHASIVPYQPFSTSDGELVITVGNDGQFQRLCAVLGQSELAADERFKNNAARVANRKPLIAILAAEIARWTRRDLELQLRREQIPCGPIQTLDQVFADPQVIERGMIVELPHATLGPIRTVANPTKYSATPLRYERAPPILGEHTDEVLSEIAGMSEPEIADLRARGII
jgi:crotonobetainyl-CoA:carnitine CoA-transferase CaiB-like acyl-CoA transferase